MKCCKNCGKELSEGVVVCPACGYSVEEETKIENMSRNENRGDVLSILSLVFGVVSFFLLGPLLGTLAIVLAHISKGYTGNVLSSKARIGQKCGIISIILWGLLIVIVIIFAGVSVSCIGSSQKAYQDYLYDSDDLYYSDDLYADYDSDDLYDNYGSYSSYYR